MDKYKGAILDADGFIVFEFITRHHVSVHAAESQGREILEAWRAVHGKAFFLAFDGQTA